ncbi:MAG TPA: hypothetical protein ENK16_07805 [Chromatiales bacterium]|nr:hypothetical protein [Chromatiales bacterium]
MGRTPVLLLMLAVVLAGSAGILASDARNWPVHGLQTGALAGLWLTLGFALRRAMRDHVATVVVSAGHRWQLRLATGAKIAATLDSAWVVGRFAGLAWRDPDNGRHYGALVCAAALNPADWRRLRVWLRFPAGNRVE